MKIDLVLDDAGWLLPDGYRWGHGTIGEIVNKATGSTAYINRHGWLTLDGAMSAAAVRVLLARDAALHTSSDPEPAR